MSLVTITVSDVDLAASTYEVGFAISESLIDDGQATAACFTAFYIQSLLPTVEFRAELKRYGEALMDAMKANDPAILDTLVPAKMIVTLEDIDLKRGSYRNGLASEGGDPTGHSLPTPSQVVGAYITKLLYDMDFRRNCWAFAEDYVRKNAGAKLGNRDESPITLSLNDDQAASIAA